MGFERQGLATHQNFGVSWLLDVHDAVDQNGAILADDMGLGKTVQVAAFLSELLSRNRQLCVLIVCPATLSNVWLEELRKWASSLVKRTLLSTDTKREQERKMALFRSTGGALITTYGLVTTRVDDLASLKLDYLILDEGHLVKNIQTRIAKAVRRLETKHRIILSGTPIQNNLDEYWSLMDFVTFGERLGTQKWFRETYSNPIVAGLQKQASESVKVKMLRLSAELKAISDKFILRRVKGEVFAEDNGEHHVLQAPPAKVELAVFCKLSEVQQRLYLKCLESRRFRDALNNARHKSPLVVLSLLKKLCDSAELLHNDFVLEIGEELPEDSLLCSGKLRLLLDLVKRLVAKSSKVLVFCQSKIMLSVIQRTLEKCGIGLARIDGDTPIPDRAGVVSDFERSVRQQVMLLTTRVGGLGLTITAADSVIIFDPDWNPASDKQAVDRVHRIGQSREAVIYRLLSAGTLEEKIYRRQIFKESLALTAMKAIEQINYFSRGELSELFEISSFDSCVTADMVKFIHQNSAPEDTREKFVEACSLVERADVAGTLNHGLLFSRPGEAGSLTPEERQNVLEHLGASVDSPIVSVARDILIDTSKAKSLTADSVADLTRSSLELFRRERIRDALTCALAACTARPYNVKLRQGCTSLFRLLHECNCLQEYIHHL